MPIPVPVVQTGLEKSIDLAAKKAGKNLRINMGPGAKSIESLAKPLGRLTGKADEFTKSMEAANARVLAFGASVGVITAVTKSLQELVRTTIQVEKSLTNINSILGQSASQLDRFKDQIFNIARNTEQTFDTVAEAALELSRQGLKAEEVTKRLNDALILSRLSGLNAADSVAGLTAAVNSFSSAGLTTSDVLNKISAAAASAAVSDRDLIEGLKRSGSVAVATGVQFDELVGIISALQERTARGGAVIGNSLKTIFTRIQDLDKLQSLQRLGVEVTDLAGNVLSSNKIIENLAPTFAKLDQATKVNLADNLVGKFQIAPFLALLEDYNLKVSRSGEVAANSFNATNEAYERNKALSQTLSAAINKATVNLKELANTLGEIGVTDNLKNIIGVFNSVVSSIQNILDGDGIGSKFAKGLIKGIGSIIAGPGLALALVAIGKLLLDFAKFGAGALQTFFGLNKAAQQQATLQGQIAASLLNDKTIRDAILKIEQQNISAGEKKKLQTQYFTKALNEQLAIMQRMQGIAMAVAPGVMKGTASRRGGRAAGGFLPVGAERNDIARGVGGAPSSAKPVVIPNFAFGGGRRGTMVANTSEYIVPNYANGGDAIFNQNMVSSMGLPANARKVRAASGFIPNFAGPAGALKAAGITNMRAFNALPAKIGLDGKKLESRTIDGLTISPAAAKAVFDRQKAKKNKKGVLNIPARVFGIAALFSDKKQESTSQDPLTLTHSYAKDLAKAGVKKITFDGVQIRTLQDAKKKLSERKNRNDLAKYFANPLAQYGRKLIGDTFSNDEAKALNAQIKKIARGDGGVRLFSAAVEGGIFESAINVATKAAGGISEFTSNKEDQIPFDFEESGIATKSFKNAFGFTSKLLKADAKRTASGDAVQSVIKKAFNDDVSRNYISRIARSKGFPAQKRAAGGYIPNFVDGALGDAIERERSAGLPISQIRVNQSGKLRNSQNPMGLAVTNTRDEPTGAIPNYAKGTPGQALDGLTTKLFALQSVMFLFQSGVGEMAKESSGASKAMFEFSQMAMQASMALMAIQAFGGLNGIGSVLGGSKGRGMIAAGRNANLKLTGGGVGLTRGNAAKVFGNSLKILGGKLLTLVPHVALVTAGFAGIAAINEKLSGSSELNKKALDMVTESSKNAAANLKKLNVGDVEDFKKTSETLAKEDLERLKSGLGNGLIPFTGKLEGSSDDVKFQNIETLIRDAYNSGATQKDVKSSIDWATSLADGGQLSVAGTAALMRSLGSLSSGKLGDNRKDLQASFEEALRKVKGVEAQNILGKEYKDKGLASEAVQASKNKIREENKQTQERVDSINLANAKARLQTAVEIRKENLKLLSSTEKAVMRAEKLGTLDDVSLLNLKQKVEQEKLLNDLASKNLDFLNSQGDEFTRLKLGKEQIKSIEKDIQKISAKDLGDKDKVLAIVKKIYKTNGLNDEVAKELADSLSIQLDQNKSLNDASKRTLDNRQAETRELTIQKQLLDEIELKTSLVAQNIQFARTNSSAGERSGLEEDRRRLERSRDIATRSNRDKQVEDLNRQIADINMQLATVARDERYASIETSARNIFSQLPESFQTFRKKEFEALQDPLVNPFDILRSFDFTRDEDLNARRLSQAQKSRVPLPPSIPTEDILKFKQELGNLEQQLIENERTEQESIKAAKDNTLSLKDLSKINMGLSKDLAPFSRSESANAARLAKAQAIVAKDPTKSVDIELRRLTMERGVYSRFSEIIPTALENANQLKQTLAQGSFDFAHNIGNAMLDAIQKGESLGDTLLSVASEFLNMISRGFMQNAVNSFLGNFGIAKQGGGPIGGGSGIKDDVPAMLMGGEFVMNKKAVKKYGMGFMSALNNGSIQGFASGGQVRDKEGMFITPGIGGAGSIVGGANLFSFATQSPIATGRDQINSYGGFLGSESGRLTVFGRRNNPEFQRVQEAKRQAFDLYVGEENAKAQARQIEKDRKKQLMDSLKGAALSAVVGAGISSMASGFSAAFQGAEGSLGSRLWTGAKGMFVGGNAGFSGNNYGGLKNLFSGNFKTAFADGPAKAIPVDIGAAIPKTAPITNSQDYNTFSNDRNPFTGPFDANGNYREDWVGYSEAQIRRLRGFATGGLIPATGGVDTVPAMLSGGEFVMNAAATRNIGAGNLQALNSGANVGNNSDLIVKLDELIRTTETSQSTGDINITINGSTGAENQSSGQDVSEQQKALSEKIKVAVKQVIADEQRLGGQLRR